MSNEVKVIKQGSQVVIDWGQTPEGDEFRAGWHGSAVIRVPFTTGTPASPEQVAERIRAAHPGYIVTVES